MNKAEKFLEDLQKLNPQEIANQINENPDFFGDIKDINSQLQLIANLEYLLKRDSVKNIITVLQALDKGSFFESKKTKTNIIQFLMYNGEIKGENLLQVIKDVPHLFQNLDPQEEQQNIFRNLYSVFSGFLIKGDFGQSGLLIDKNFHPFLEKLKIIISAGLYAIPRNILSQLPTKHQYYAYPGDQESEKKDLFASKLLDLYLQHGYFEYAIEHFEYLHSTISHHGIPPSKQRELLAQYMETSDAKAEFVVDNFTKFNLVSDQELQLKILKKFPDSFQSKNWFALAEKLIENNLCLVFLELFEQNSAPEVSESRDNIFRNFLSRMARYPRELITIINFKKPPYKFFQNLDEHHQLQIFNTLHDHLLSYPEELIKLIPQGIYQAPPQLIHKFFVEMKGKKLIEPNTLITIIDAYIQIGQFSYAEQFLQYAHKIPKFPTDQQKQKVKSEKHRAEAEKLSQEFCYSLEKLPTGSDLRETEPKTAESTESETVKAIEILISDIENKTKENEEEIDFETEQAITQALEDLPQAEPEQKAQIIDKLFKKLKTLKTPALVYRYLTQKITSILSKFYEDKLKSIKNPQLRQQYLKAILSIFKQYLADEGSPKNKIPAFDEIKYLFELASDVWDVIQKKAEMSVQESDKIELNNLCLEIINKFLKNVKDKKGLTSTELARVLVPAFLRVAKISQKLTQSGQLRLGQEVQNDPSLYASVILENQVIVNSLVARLSRIHDESGGEKLLKLAGTSLENLDQALGNFNFDIKEKEITDDQNKKLSRKIKLNEPGIAFPNEQEIMTVFNKISAEVSKMIDEKLGDLKFRTGEYVVQKITTPLERLIISLLFLVNYGPEEYVERLKEFLFIKLEESAAA